MTLSNNNKTSYKKYLNSDGWTKKRRHAFVTLGNVCEICHSKEELEVHHNNYTNLGKEKPRRDLVVLCQKCHQCLHLKVRAQELGYNPGKKACSLCSLWPCEWRKTRPYVSRRRLNLCTTCYDALRPHIIIQRTLPAARRLSKRSVGIPQRKKKDKQWT